MKKALFFLFAFCSICTEGYAQAYHFATDDIQRGYYNRPYKRYEAEPDFCSTNGSFLAASNEETDLQCEASHQQALQLVEADSYVAWEVVEAGDGLTIRFSLPDNAEGTGTKGELEVYASDEKVGTIQISSFWAWQYTVGGSPYPLNKPVPPGNGNVVRMPFDETHLRLSRMVQAGEVLKVVKTDKNDIPYTIDFVELEQIPSRVEYDDVTGEKIQFDGQGDVGEFIMAHQGETIYLPEGIWETNRRIHILEDDTQVIGAGMWYTQIWFTASSDDSETYPRRGFECDKSNVRIEGLYMNTMNHGRYFQGDEGRQVGKGFMGNWGSNGVIRGCWVEHFECGAWIGAYGETPSKNLLVEFCRFRNNYADGINCSQNTRNHLIRFCSFRNNGDDDMASWSTGGTPSEGITYEYCTAENNWRASSLGFFGGKGMHAHDIYIVDGLECGARLNADFEGPGFASTDSLYLHHITIEHCGCVEGTRGNVGDFWGQVQGAVNVGGTHFYDVNGVVLENIEIVGSRSYGLYVKGGENNVNGLRVRDVHIDGAQYGVYFEPTLKGSGSYRHLTFDHLSYKDYNSKPSQFTWTEAAR